MKVHGSLWHRFGSQEIYGKVLQVVQAKKHSQESIELIKWQMSQTKTALIPFTWHIKRIFKIKNINIYFEISYFNQGYQYEGKKNIVNL